MPGADHAVMTGARSVQLRTIPATPAPIEMPQTHEANMASGTRPACAAWIKMASGPENDTSTARKPAAMADGDQSDQPPAPSAGRKGSRYGCTA